MNYRLLIIGQLPPPHHGSNVMTEMFIKSLKNLGCNITIVEKTFSKRIEDVRRLSILKIFKIPVVTSLLIYRLVRNKYDLCFYFLSIKPPSIFVDAFFLFFIRMFRIKYVLYLHAKGLIDLNEQIVRPLRSFVKKTISLSLGALVLGERLKMDVDKYIPSKRLFVLPNAIADIELENLKFDCNCQEVVKIVFLSNLEPSKGPMEFLKMAKSLVEKRKDVKFILAGPKISEPFQKKIINYIRKEGLSDFIEMPGGIYGTEKEKFFHESDIFVFPTYYDLEAFPLVNLEAMRAGLPVVSSDEGSIPEMVIDGLNGYIVDPKNEEQLADRVLRLIEDSELRSNMGKAGRRIYEDSFTINAYEKRLEQGLKFFFELKDGSDALLDL